MFIVFYKENTCSLLIVATTYDTINLRIHFIERLLLSFGPGIDSASNINQHQGRLLWVKATGA
jgi:hypothetical protein